MKSRLLKSLLSLLSQASLNNFEYSIKTAHRVFFGVPYFLTKDGERFESENENTQKKGNESAAFTGCLYYEKFR